MDEIYIATRLVACMIIEGLLQSSSFASSFWIKKNLLPGFCLSYEYIPRDESLHVMLAVILYDKLNKRSSENLFVEIVREAVDIKIGVHN